MKNYSVSYGAIVQLLASKQMDDYGTCHLGTRISYLCITLKGTTQ
jgi:hypothetical protein